MNYKADWHFQLPCFHHFLLLFVEYSPQQNLVVKSMTLHKSGVHGISSCYLYCHQIDTVVVRAKYVMVVFLVTAFQGH